MRAPGPGPCDSRRAPGVRLESGAEGPRPPGPPGVIHSSARAAAEPQRWRWTDGRGEGLGVGPEPPEDHTSAGRRRRAPSAPSLRPSEVRPVPYRRRAVRVRVDSRRVRVVARPEGRGAPRAGHASAPPATLTHTRPLFYRRRPLRRTRRPPSASGLLCPSVPGGVGRPSAARRGSRPSPGSGPARLRRRPPAGAGRASLAHPHPLPRPCATGPDPASVGGGGAGGAEAGDSVGLGDQGPSSFPPPRPGANPSRTSRGFPNWRDPDLAPRSGPTPHPGRGGAAGPLRRAPEALRGPRVPGVSSSPTTETDLARSL